MRIYIGRPETVRNVQYELLEEYYSFNTIFQMGCTSISRRTKEKAK